MSKDVESLWVSSATLQGLCWELKCGLRDRAVIIAEIDRCISSMADEISLLRQPECCENEIISIPATDTGIQPEVSDDVTDIETETENEDKQAPEYQNNECLTQECAMIAESTLTEEAADADPEPVTEPESETATPQSEPEIIPAEEPEPENAVAAVEPEQTEGSAPTAETEIEPEPEKTEKPVEIPERKPEPIPLDRKLSRKVMADIRKAFTVNDKFLFRRELFGNSAQQYDEAMNLISEMQSYEDARDYFFGQFGWDSDNNEVKRFMEILENHFNS